MTPSFPLHLGKGGQEVGFNTSKSELTNLNDSISLFTYVIIFVNNN